MIAARRPCDPQRLQWLLDGRLTAEIAAEVTEHIDGCDACRRQLETLAADDLWWQEARSFLSDDPATDDAAAAERYDSGAQLVLSYLTPAEDAEILGHLDGFEILEVIGCGGMGIVLKGRDRQLNRLVAIKMLAPHLSTTAAARQRFAREAQAAAAVVHPHVLAIHGVNGAGKLPYLIMPLVAGHSLQDRIDRQGPLDVKDVLRIGMQAAQGLAAAHAQGLVHRDVKPANILLENGVDRVLLTDFGLARAADDASLTRSGVIAGTPQYMSPEQTRGDGIDHRTDLFSLGAVMYAICAGRPPFRAETTMGVLRRICEDTPRSLPEINPDAPDWLATIIGRLMAKSPDDRFQSADEVAVLLEQRLAHVQHPGTTPLPPVMRVDRGGSKRHRRLVGIAAGVALPMVVIAVLICGWPGLRTTPSGSGGGAPSEATASGSARHRASDGAHSPAADNDATDWHDGIEQELWEIDYGLRGLHDMDEF